MSRSTFAPLFLAIGLLGLFLLMLRHPEAEQELQPEPRRDPIVVPGLQSDGRIQLPNQWSLRPVDTHVPLGDFPVNMALHPSGKWLAILHAGFGDHEVMILDAVTKKKISRTALDQTFYGLCFSPDGKQLFASGGERERVHQFDFIEGRLGNAKEIELVKKEDKFIPAGVVVDAQGKTLFVAGPWGQAIFRIPLDNPEKKVRIETGKDSFPFTCLPSSDGKRLYVSLWGAATVAVVDLEKGEVVERWEAEKHPTEMVLSPDGKTLFVACANSTRVSVFNTTNGKALQTLDAALYPAVPSGNTPNSLTMTPDGQLLFVANADNNNLAVFNIAEPGKGRPMGFIPVGWYPTSVRYHAASKQILVANGKGLMPKANRHGPNPIHSKKPLEEYIGGLLQGTLSTIALPSAEKLAAYTKDAFLCSPLRADAGVTAKRSQDNPIPAKVGDKSPIKHCIYIIKENRTYDQVFGDIKEGNGDPTICIFPEKVTPNHHRLAKEFVLLDNFYVESEVSADGHQWTMAAYCTDYVEKVWPLAYRSDRTNKFGYPSEGNNDVMERPAGGYLWDRAAEAGVSYRSYGEWVNNGKTVDDPGKARVKALEGHFDPRYRGYDLDYPDVKRAERFISELNRFEKEGEMPRLQIMRLPNDHTYGTRVGKPTPTALVADNDLALGMVIEALSKSKFWKDTAVFVIEDDAQNGPDHVDAHRTVALVISPYTKRKHVDSTMYSTASMLRTMELILGLKPMSQFDAAAKPMYASFQSKPDLTPYKAIVPEVDREEKNKATAWGAKLSEELNLATEDAADDLLFNEIIWRSVKGPNTSMPAPVRAAFVVPHVD